MEDALASTANSAVNPQDLAKNTPPEVSNTHPSNEGDSDVDNKESENDDSSKRKEMEPRAEIWQYCLKIQCPVDEIQKAKCKFCSRVLRAGGKKWGTTGLHRHHSTCKLSPPYIATNQARLNLQKPLFEASGKKGIVPFSPLWKYDEKAARRALALMFIVDECPFKHVEHDGFRNLMTTVCPQFHLPSRKTLGKDIFRVYEEERIKLKFFLKTTSQRVSFTTDTWTSIQKNNYMCLTAHFVDNDWKLQKRILSFCPILSHKGEDIGKAIEKCIRKWGVENVFTVTVDNASSNGVALEYLKKRMDVWKTSVLGNKYVHMRCVAHIFNLIVQDGLKEKEEDDAISCIRGAVKYIKSSPGRVQAFRDCVVNEAIETKRLLCLDVPTRWNSTCLMLETALLLKNAVNSFCENDSYKRDLEQAPLRGVPTEEHWLMCERLVNFLGCFQETTEKVSKSLHVTSHSVFHEISSVLLTLREALGKIDEDTLLWRMAMKMQEKFDKYWGPLRDTNFILYYAVVLDPRYKMELIKFSFDDMYDSVICNKMKKAVYDGLVELFEDYKVRYGDEATHSTNASSSKPPLPEVEKKKRPTYKVLKKLKTVVEGSESVKSELERYLAEDVEPDVDDDDSFDILIWWKVNASRFPILSKVARDILGVPVSTVASESAFSTSGRVLDAFRSSLLPKTVEALICTQDWIRRSDSLVTVEEDINEADQFEAEWSNVNVEASASGSAATVTNG